MPLGRRPASQAGNAAKATPEAATFGIGKGAQVLNELLRWGAAELLDVGAHGLMIQLEGLQAGGLQVVVDAPAFEPGMMSIGPCGG